MSSRPEATTTFVRVERGAGELATWLRGAGVEIVELDEPRSLSPLLRAALGLPHVVGWADMDARIVWLVDLARWRRGPPPRRAERHPSADASTRAAEPEAQSQKQSGNCARRRGIRSRTARRGRSRKASPAP